MYCKFKKGDLVLYKGKVYIFNYVSYSKTSYWLTDRLNPNKGKCVRKDLVKPYINFKTVFNKLDVFSGGQ